MAQVRDLHPIYSPNDIFDEMEKRMCDTWLKQIYYPLLKELQIPKTTIENSPMSDFQAFRTALENGKITFNKGVFSGKWNASISRTMKVFGAKWHPQSKTFRINLDDLPREVQVSISSSENAFVKKIKTLDDKLKTMLDAVGQKPIPFSDLFDKAIFRASKDFQENVKNISIVPEITIDQMKKISKEYTNNMNLWINDFEEQQIVSLRLMIQESYFKGDRYGSLVKSIQDSYRVSEGKATFLAKQETRLLISKYNESQYVPAGFPEYRWNCVAGSPAHPVRPMHKKLDGTIQRWDSPPVVNEKGERKNCGCDYGCRCFPTPIYRPAGVV